MAQKYLIRRGEDREATFELRQEGGITLVRREDSDEWKVVGLERVGDSGLYLLMIDNRPTEIYLERRRGGADVTIGRHTFSYDVGPWRPAGRRAKAGAPPSGLVRIAAPMTGSIVEVRCAPGDVVVSGQVLLVMESMKMNNELRSPADGTVEAVPVVAGARVKANELLVSLRTI
ncbi:MAG: biotin/lipoyl-binding protein [Chloroflexi bacterium]|nr:biotin/lipoyl-binding protein [Chloroflexota bacterium]